MSLTNPYALVNEERLAEFYQTISPYLGGMPDILANKFAKGDMYSTDEKMIGQWTDGKPLYQKTVDCGALPNNGTKVVDLGLGKNSVEVVSVNAVSKSGNQYIPMPYISTSSSWNVYFEINDNSGANNLYAQIVTSANWSSATCYVTIQYTKTTDSAVYIGDDTDYSTDEKIVGTWIDGKPLYQKTYNLGDFPNNNQKNITIDNYSSINEVVKLDCFAKTKSGVGGFSVPRPNVNLYVNTGGFFTIVTSADYSGNTAYATMQYTKKSS